MELDFNQLINHFGTLAMMFLIRGKLDEVVKLVQLESKKDKKPEWFQPKADLFLAYVKCMEKEKPKAKKRPAAPKDGEAKKEGEQPKKKRVKKVDSNGNPVTVAKKKTKVSDPLVEVVDAKGQSSYVPVVAGGGMLYPDKPKKKKSPPKQKGEEPVVSYSK